MGSQERLPEHDGVDADDGPALSRTTGAEPDPDAPDHGSTTGTTNGGEFVGRVAGQDVGSAGEQGAERRAAWEAEQQS